jgi:branched-chain amino acid transport system permease protein
VFRYKLTCFAIAGALAGLAGALIANQNMLVSPSLVHWTQSGSLMVMVILGGAGYFWGGALGAFALLLLEEVLSGYTEHWQLPLGVLLLAVVLLLPKGMASLADRFNTKGAVK